jgi:hypothetical protein
VTAAENPPGWPLVADQAGEGSVLPADVVPAEELTPAEDGVLVGDVSLIDDTAGSAENSGPEPDRSWLPGGDLRGVERRWRDIQVSFVDEPRKAVADANTLVADLMRRLAQMLFDERAALEQRCLGPEDASTEDLRQGLRQYRAVFQRLLAGGW